MLCIITIGIWTFRYQVYNLHKQFITSLSISSLCPHDIFPVKKYILNITSSNDANKYLADFVRTYVHTKTYLLLLHLYGMNTTDLHYNLQSSPDFVCTYVLKQGATEGDIVLTLSVCMYILKCTKTLRNPLKPLETPKNHRKPSKPPQNPLKPPIYPCVQCYFFITPREYNSNYQYKFNMSKSGIQRQNFNILKALYLLKL